MTENADYRYKQFIEILQRSPFYKSLGAVYPYRDESYVWTFTNLPALRTFQVFLNSELLTDETSDALGTIVVKTPRELAPGAYNLQLRDYVEDRQYNAYFDIRNLGTLTAAQMDFVGELDDRLDEIENSLAIPGSSESYAYPVYGRRVEQDKLALMEIADYRKLLATLHFTYGHFAGIKRGTEQAVEAMLSTSPFYVPKAWTPGFVPGYNLALNGAGLRRTRDHAQRLQPAGVDYPALNRASTNYVHPGFGSGATWASIQANLVQPPRPQKLLVSVSGMAGSLSITGILISGVEDTEVLSFPITTTETIVTANDFARITNISFSGSFTSISLGLAEDRFIRVARIGDLTPPSSFLLYVRRNGLNTGFDARLSATGPFVRVPSSGVYSLSEVDRPAHLISRSYIDPLTPVMNLVPSLLRNEIDGYNTLEYDTNGHTYRYVITPATNYTQLITAMSDAVGAGDLDSCAELLDTGANPDRYSIELQALEGNEIRFRRTGHDLAPFLFKDRSKMSFMNSAAGAGATQIQVSVGTNFPSSDFNVRVRGFTRRDDGLSNDGTVWNNNGTWYFTSPSYVFTARDVGASLRVQRPLNFDNYSINEVINSSLVSLVPISLNVIGESATSWSLAHPHGEIVRALNYNSSTGVIALAAPGLAGAWDQFAIVELDEDIVARPYPALSNLDIEVNTDFSPFSGHGDTITPGNPASLSSARGVFTGLSGQIVISGCTNPTNNGTFNINNVVNGTHLTFTNPNAIAETSQFRWEIIPLSSTLRFDIGSIQGSTLPDGWSTNAGTTIQIGHLASGLLTRNRIFFSRDDDTQPVHITIPIELAREHRGKRLEVRAWVGEHRSFNEPAYDIQVAYGSLASNPTFTSIFTGSPPTVPGSTVFTGILYYAIEPALTGIQGSFFVPRTAEQCHLRIVRSATAGLNALCSIEAVEVRAVQGRSARVGTRSVVRSAKRTKFRDLIYVWDTLPQSAEAHAESLGVTPSGYIPERPGHIDRLAPSHTFPERFDVSDLKIGLYDSTAWSRTSSRENLSHVVASPDLLSGAEPNNLSLVTDEDLTFFTGTVGDPVGSARANLVFNARMLSGFASSPTVGGAPNSVEPKGYRLLETRTIPTTFNQDGRVYTIPAGTPIPVPDAPVSPGANYPWQFISPTQIRVNDFNPASTYTLTYPTRLMAVTEPLQLASLGVTLADHMWLVDFAHSEPPKMIANSLYTEEQAIFFGDFRATLSGVVDATKTSILYQDDGVTKKEVPVGTWSVVDSNQIRIDPAVFNADYLYSITYYKKTLVFERGPTYTIEWRSAASEAGLASASWIEVKPNQALNSNSTSSPATNVVDAWHQLRVFMDNLDESTFLATGVTPSVYAPRIYGLGIKGFRIVGSPTPPGL